MRESKFQSEFIKRLKKEFPECIILKNDPGYIQGVPDLLVLHGRNWAALEVKASSRAPHRPNQDYYIDLMGRMSFAAFVCPENVEEVVYGLQEAFRPER